MPKWLSTQNDSSKNTLPSTLPAQHANRALRCTVTSPAVPLVLSQCHPHTADSMHRPTEAARSISQMSNSSTGHVVCPGRRRWRRRRRWWREVRTHSGWNRVDSVVPPTVCGPRNWEPYHRTSRRLRLRLQRSGGNAGPLRHSEATPKGFTGIRSVGGTAYVTCNKPYEQDVPRG